MQRKAITPDEQIFVIEICQNCKEHHWNTRHDEAKYEEFYHKSKVQLLIRVASIAILQRLPNAVILRNQIPKSYVHYDLYVNLIPNDDDTCPIFDQVPRTGALEVSYKGMLIFSKLQGGYWPNTQLVADKCYNLIKDEGESKDLKRYFAGNSPTKNGGVKQSSVAKGSIRNQTTRSPAKIYEQSTSDAFIVSTVRQQQQHKVEGNKFSTTHQQPAVQVKQTAKTETYTKLPSQKNTDKSDTIINQEKEKEKQKEQEKEKEKEKEKQKKFVDPGQPKQSTVAPQKHVTQNQTAQIKKQETPTYSDQYEDSQEQEEPTEIEPEKPADQEMGSHLKTYSALNDGFPIFPPQTHSLLSKFLTRDIWNQLKDKQDKEGFSFKQAIFSGCQNTDSGVGVYAGSQDSYYAFAPLFDNLIEAYHGFSKSSIHRSDMDYKKLKTPLLPEDEAALIKSTRIRVGRNLAHYPLGPGVNRQQRLEIEKKVIDAVHTFDGELKGKYYSLSSLTDSERKQLIDDHFLFKEGDRFLEACGLNRDWPEGRGIFHNEEKTFLVWVNEEDQLRIISMQNGDDIGSVFKRLSLACEHIQKVAQFSHDAHLGYITSCPTNLGTALRASVHIFLPELGKRKAEFEAIADQYNVQIRGAHGEHTETNDHIYDISNRRRLGRSEVDLVQDMYNGVKAMITREKELTKKESSQDVQCGSKLTKYQHLTGFPIFPDGTKSLLSKYLTKEIWEKLKYARDAYGFRFREAILSGCQNTDSGIGVYAGSHDSYYTFADLFDKIIQAYHNHGIQDKHISNMDYKKLHAPAFPEEEAQMIKSTRIRVGRNLKDYPLGPGLNRQQRLEIESKVIKALSTFEGELAGKYYSLTSLSEEERKQLIDDHFLFKEGDRFLEACGLNRDWPEGRGIFHNTNKTFLVWVNEEDQLRIISMQQGANLGEVFTRLSKACSHIEKVAQFSHDDHLGYITSCPTNLGTALRASVHIQLPMLGERAEFEEIANKYHVQIRGIHGEHSETADHVYDISNKRRLGRSEVDLVQDMYNGVKAMINREKELQEELKMQQAEILKQEYLKKQEELKREQEQKQKEEHERQQLEEALKKEQEQKQREEQIKKEQEEQLKREEEQKQKEEEQRQLEEALKREEEQKQREEQIKKEQEEQLKREQEEQLKREEEQKQKEEEQRQLEEALRLEQEQKQKQEEELRKQEEQKQKEEQEKQEQEVLKLQQEQQQKQQEEIKEEVSHEVQLDETQINAQPEQLTVKLDQPVIESEQPTVELQQSALEVESHIVNEDIRSQRSQAQSMKQDQAAEDRHTVMVDAFDEGGDLIHENFNSIKTPFEATQQIQRNSSKQSLMKKSDSKKSILTELDYMQQEQKIMEENNKFEYESQQTEFIKPAQQTETQCGPHLSNPEQLKAMPKFPEGTKSLLSKFFTQEVWAHLKDKKDKAGFSFKQAIFSGCQNTDSGIGVYAGSHDSYTAFAPLFDKIIETYHGHNSEAKHQSDMDVAKLECPPLQDDESSMIVSTRIRVGRNLADFPLGPALQKQQRLNVEETVVKALSSFEGDLKGTYYSLQGMDEDTRKKMIEDHFLFKEGDRFLEACGLNRDWPEGRGIFHNDEKTFLVWVNEEDQLRIISMQQGSDILKVFDRLSRACAHIEQVAKFAHDDHLGYITSCPTNLGTALRASVHIKLPLLGERPQEFEEMASKYHIQIRGIHGEHSETADHIYDISNKRRLGLSEVQLVQDMYNGVKAMIAREKELQQEQKH